MYYADDFVLVKEAAKIFAPLGISYKWLANRSGQKSGVTQKTVEIKIDRYKKKVKRKVVRLFDVANKIAGSEINSKKMSVQEILRRVGVVGNKNSDDKSEPLSFHSPPAWGKFPRQEPADEVARKYFATFTVDRNLFKEFVAKLISDSYSGKLDRIKEDHETLLNAVSGLESHVSDSAKILEEVTKIEKIVALLVEWKVRIDKSLSVTSANAVSAKKDVATVQDNCKKELTAKMNVVNTRLDIIIKEFEKSLKDANKKFEDFMETTIRKVVQDELEDPVDPEYIFAEVEKMISEKLEKKDSVDLEEFEAKFNGKIVDLGAKIKGIIEALGRESANKTTVTNIIDGRLKNLEDRLVKKIGDIVINVNQRISEEMLGIQKLGSAGEFKDFKSAQKEIDRLRGENRQLKEDFMELKKMVEAMKKSLQQDRTSILSGILDKLKSD